MATKDRLRIEFDAANRQALADFQVKVARANREYTEDMRRNSERYKNSRAEERATPAVKE